MRLVRATQHHRIKEVSTYCAWADDHTWGHWLTLSRWSPGAIVCRLARISRTLRYITLSGCTGASGRGCSRGGGIVWGLASCIIQGGCRRGRSALVGGCRLLCLGDAEGRLALGRGGIFLLGGLVGILCPRQLLVLPIPNNISDKKSLERKGLRDSKTTACRVGDEEGGWRRR